MSVGATEITQAREGIRIAAVFDSHNAALDELDRIAELAGTGVEANRGSGHLAIDFETGGQLRFLTASHDPTDSIYDSVIFYPGCVTDELLEQYARTVATTEGTLSIEAELVDDTEPTGGILVCLECGAQLADNNPTATIRHEADGGHSYQQ